MNNIHFYNIESGKHEYCNMSDWCLMHCQSFVAQVIIVLKLVGLPIAFSMKGSDGDGYIIADDESFNNKFSMAHEEGHLKLGHYDSSANVKIDEFGLLMDDDAEMAADKYAIEHGASKQLALDTISTMLDNVNADLIPDKFLILKSKLGLARRMLNIANL